MAEKNYYVKFICTKCNESFSIETDAINHTKCCLIEDEIIGKKINSIRLKNDKLTIFMENECEININVQQNRLLDIKVEQSLPF